MVFIRAPKISRVGPGVEVVATEGNDPVAVRQGRVMATTFHPELSGDRADPSSFSRSAEVSPPPTLSFRTRSLGEESAFP